MDAYAKDLPLRRCLIQAINKAFVHMVPRA